MGTNENKSEKTCYNLKWFSNTRIRIIRYWHGRHFFLLERGVASELGRHVGVGDKVILVGVEVLLHQGQHHLEGNNDKLGHFRC